MEPSELFTKAPHWAYLGALYFFVGGISGGCYFIAAMLDLVGRSSDRHLSRLGYLVAFPAIALGGLILIIDLKQPQRFWHMLVQSETFWPMLKWWSPISYGSWILSAFGAFAFISFLAALVRPGDTPQSGPLRVFQKIQYGLGPLSKLFLILGALFGLWVASYTGVLLSVTNRPVWANSSMISLLFLVSGVSAAAATLILLGGLRRRTISHDLLHTVARFDDWVLLVELVVLGVLLFSLRSILGAMGTGWLIGWGLALLILVVLLGILAPLALTMRPRGAGTRTLMLAAVLVLLGGLVLRYVVVMSSEFSTHV